MFKDNCAYDYDTCANAFRVTKKKPIAVRWVDLNKGDDVNPDHRSRLVAKEINTGANDDLFAATPPIEALKIIMRIASYRRSQSYNIKILFADVRRAYFNAEATRDVFVQLPPEDEQYGYDGVCGKLRLSMYGTRDASQNWERECAGKLLSWGFTRGSASSCVYYHKQRDIQLYIHGDDFIAVGEDAQVIWLRKQLQSAYDIKCNIMGDSIDNVKEQKILNRIVTWTSKSLEYEADPRHAEIIIKYAEDNKTSRIPGSKTDQDRELFAELTSDEASQYRAAAARCNFLAIDRPDIQFASKEASKYMSSPRECDWDMIRKIARY